MQVSITYPCVRMRLLLNAGISGICGQLGVAFVSFDSPILNLIACMQHA